MAENNPTGYFNSKGNRNSFGPTDPESSQSQQLPLTERQLGDGKKSKKVLKKTTTRSKLDPSVPYFGTQINNTGFYNENMASENRYMDAGQSLRNPGARYDQFQERSNHQQYNNSTFQRPDKLMAKQDTYMYDENTRFDAKPRALGDMMIEEPYEGMQSQQNFNSRQYSQNTLSTQCTMSQVDRLTEEFSPFHPLSTQSENSYSQQGSLYSQGSFPTHSQGTPKNQFYNESGRKITDINNQNAHPSTNKKIYERNGSLRQDGLLNSQGSMMISKSGTKNFSDNKTVSTCISGSDSPPRRLQLECEETLGKSMTSSRRKHDQNTTSPWSMIDEGEMNQDPRKNNEMEVSNFDIHGIVEEKKTNTPSIEEDLANFNPDSINVGIDQESMAYLVLREQDYAPDPYGLDKKQKEVNGTMRAILIDWMIEVADEFTLKRETLHYAINYIDRFLSKVENIRREDFQLLGITALHIASKTEEVYPPKMEDFKKIASDCYSLDQIRDMEMKMLKELKWLLNPPTLNTWLQWYMTQWDIYVQHVPQARNHPLMVKYGSPIQFKQADQKSYVLYRELMQLVDCAVLNNQTLQYATRTLVAAFMYLILGKHLGAFTVEQIFTELSQSSSYLLNATNPINGLFGDFALYCFEFKLADILPSVQYASTYFLLQMIYELPKAAKWNQEAVLEGHFEEFLAYQTHHPQAKEYLKYRQQYCR